MIDAAGRTLAHYAPVSLMKHLQVPNLELQFQVSVPQL